MSAVVWHDLECGAYAEDLPLWRELAGAGPVLDVGAGTGRVALDLARRGVPVVALDVEEALLAALRERAGDLPVETVCADATAFDLGRTFPVVLVPMQTVQLLEDAAARGRFLRCAHRHLEPGGVLAAALADAREAIADDPAAPLPLPDMREQDGVVWASRPLAVVDEGDRAAIHRLREVVQPDGTRTEALDVVRLAHLPPEVLEAEARDAGLRVLGRREVGATDDYLGSDVVVVAR